MLSPAVTLPLLPSFYRPLFVCSPTFSRFVRLPEIPKLVLTVVSHSLKENLFLYLIIKRLTLFTTTDGDDSQGQYVLNLDVFRHLTIIKSRDAFTLN